MKQLITFYFLIISATLFAQTDHNSQKFYPDYRIYLQELEQLARSSNLSMKPPMQGMLGWTVKENYTVDGHPKDIYLSYSQNTGWLKIKDYDYTKSPAKRFTLKYNVYTGKVIVKGIKK